MEKECLRTSKILGPVIYFRTFRMLTYLGCSRQSQTRTWRTRQRQISASTAKLSAGRTKLKSIANDKRLNGSQTYRGGALSIDEYVHLYYASSSSSYSLTLTNVQTSFSTPHSFIGLRSVASRPGWSNFSCLTW